jgi:hypothetical protein
MPRFEYQMQRGQSPELPAKDVPNDFDAARKAALGIRADSAKDIVTGLTEDSEWRPEVRNESGDSIFRSRFPAKTLEPAS